MTPLRAGSIVAAAAFAVDQISKNFVLYGLDFWNLGPAARVDITAFLDLVMVWNRGVSYGLLPASGLAGTLILTIFSLVAVVLLAWWMVRSDRVFLSVALGFVIGGALGNVIDRILYGAVVDFFHFHAFGRDWYVFNVADAAITVGVVMLIGDALIRPEERQKDSEKVVRK